MTVHQQRRRIRKATGSASRHYILFALTSDITGQEHLYKQGRRPGLSTDIDTVLFV